MSAITIPAGAIDGLVAKAIIDSMSEEAKQAIIEQAVVFLLEQPETDNGYGRKTKGESPMQMALNGEVRRIANEVAHELSATLRPRIVEAMQSMVKALGDADAEYDWDLQAKLMKAILDWRDDREKAKNARGY
jgi:hypothetical protein